MQVQILGSSAGGPFQGRNYSAQVLRVENHHFLIDCGEGTQQQLFKYGVKADRFRQIFISHLHGDHVYGLVGLLTSYCLKRRSEKLMLFSPPGLQELVEASFRLTGVHVPFTLEFSVVETGRSVPVFENKQVEVWTVAMRHRIPCAGWLFREKPRPRNLRKEEVERLQMSHEDMQAVKAGADLVLPGGQVVPNEQLTYPPRPKRSYAFCSDTAYSEQVIESVSGVDLLYHEATFTQAQIEEAALSFHSTAAQAASVAKQAGAGKLLLGHFSSRYKDTGQHLLEARGIFQEVYAVEEGATYEI